MFAKALKVLCHGTKYPLMPPPPPFLQTKYFCATMIKYFSAGTKNESLGYIRLPDTRIKKNKFAFENWSVLCINNNRVFRCIIWFVKSIKNFSCNNECEYLKKCLSESYSLPSNHWLSKRTCSKFWKRRQITIFNMGFSLRKYIRSIDF